MKLENILKLLDVNIENNKSLVDNQKQISNKISNVSKTKIKREYKNGKENIYEKLKKRII